MTIINSKGNVSGPEYFSYLICKNLIVLSNLLPKFSAKINQNMLKLLVEMETITKNDEKFYEKAILRVFFGILKANSEVFPKSMKIEEVNQIFEFVNSFLERLTLSQEKAKSIRTIVIFLYNILNEILNLSEVLDLKEHYPKIYKISIKNLSVEYFTKLIVENNSTDNKQTKNYLDHVLKLFLASMEISKKLSKYSVENAKNYFSIYSSILNEIKTLKLQNKNQSYLFETLTIYVLQSIKEISLFDNDNLNKSMILISNFLEETEFENFTKIQDEGNIYLKKIKVIKKNI
jgi:hypothetical protein